LAAHLTLTVDGREIDLSPFAAGLQFHRWADRIETTDPEAAAVTYRPGPLHAALHLLVSPGNRTAVEDALAGCWERAGVAFVYRPAVAPAALTNPAYSGAGTLYRLRAPGVLGAGGYILIELDVDGPVTRSTA
jgi:hypothetical protein